MAMRIRKTNAIIGGALVIGEYLHTFISFGNHIPPNIVDLGLIRQGLWFSKDHSLCFDEKSA